MGGLNPFQAKLLGPLLPSSTASHDTHRGYYRQEPNLPNHSPSLLKGLKRPQATGLGQPDDTIQRKRKSHLGAYSGCRESPPPSSEQKTKNELNPGGPAARPLAGHFLSSLKSHKRGREGEAT